MKIAFFCGEYPVDSDLGGIGLRIWEIAQVFAQDFEVKIITPRCSDFKSDVIELLPAQEHEKRAILAWCDIALFGDMPDPFLLLAAHYLNKVIICDNSVPIEHIYYHDVKMSALPNDSYQLLVRIFELQILVSDIFLVRAPVERATLLSALALTNRLNYSNFEASSTLEHIVFDVPIGFNALSEIHAKSNPSSLKKADYTWNGGVWDYYDASAVIQAIAAARNKKKDVSLRFMYPLMKDKGLTEPGKALQLIDTYDLGKFIEVPAKSVGHYQRDSIIKSTRALISLAKPGIENQTCHRLRLRDAFLYELPIIVDIHGETGEFVHNKGIGLAVDTTDLSQVEREMMRLLSDTNLYIQCRENIKTYRQNVLYEKSLISVKKRLQNGARSPDRNLSELETRIVSAVQAIPGLDMNKLTYFGERS